MIRKKSNNPSKPKNCPESVHKDSFLTISSFDKRNCGAAFYFSCDDFCCALLNYMVHHFFGLQFQMILFTTFLQLLYLNVTILVSDSFILKLPIEI